MIIIIVLICFSDTVRVFRPLRITVNSFTEQFAVRENTRLKYYVIGKHVNVSRADNMDSIIARQGLSIRNVSTRSFDGAIVPGIWYRHVCIATT